MSKPAFPLKEAGVNESLTGIVDNEGMSLLEYYAGQASIPWETVVNAFYETNARDPSVEEVIILRAKFRFFDAEAMEKEAEKRSK